MVLRVPFLRSAHGPDNAQKDGECCQPTQNLGVSGGLCCGPQAKVGPVENSGRRLMVVRRRRAKFWAILIEVGGSWHETEYHCVLPGLWFAQQDLDSGASYVGTAACQIQWPTALSEDTPISASRKGSNKRTPEADRRALCMPKYLVIQRSSYSANSKSKRL